MQRREFIMAGTSALACASMGTTAAWAAKATHGATADAPATRAAGNEFSQATFEALLDQRFNVVESGQGTALQLISVKDQRSVPGHEQFTLTFAGRSSVPLENGIYAMDNAQTGKIQLYLEPAGVSPQGALYRAHFSLLG